MHCALFLLSFVFLIALRSNMKMWRNMPRLCVARSQNILSAVES